LTEPNKVRYSAPFFYNLGYIEFIAPKENSGNTTEIARYNPAYGDNFVH
jgi:hypothetical protein